MWDGPVADLNGIFGSVVTGELLDTGDKYFCVDQPAPNAQRVETSFPSVPDAAVSRIYGQPSSQNIGHISQETDALQGNPRNELLLQDIDLDEVSFAREFLDFIGH